MTMGTRLRNIREDNDKYQEDVAKLLGISQQYYSNYETNKQEMPARHIKRFCEEFNISADYIIGLIDEPIAIKCCKKCKEGK